MPFLSFRQYLLNKPESWLDFPFGKEVEVYKIDKKMFALATENDGLVSLNLKCDPAQAFILRDIFESVVPGYHMNKRHWNTVYLDGSIPSGEIERMIDHSYGLLVKGMTRRRRLSLELAHGIDKLYCE
jgi:predicted DNA-binding protein (MmcQ/YjbR family)